jgi:hypothetical protein
MSRTARRQPDCRQFARDLLRIRRAGVEQADDHVSSTLALCEYPLSWRISDPSGGDAVLIDREHRAIFQQREILRRQVSQIAAEEQRR